MRPSADHYFMEVARVASTRATCDRKLVGAVIVVNGSIVSTGYNGAPRGLPHCTDVGHELVEYVVGHHPTSPPGMGGVELPDPERPITVKSCVRTAHAELNAIAQAARRGVSIEGGTLYTTASCCYDCAKMVINAGIRRVVAMEVYQSRYGKSGDVNKLFEQAGVSSHLLGQDAPEVAPVVLDGDF
jgi:dCMP deaminase